MSISSISPAGEAKAKPTVERLAYTIDEAAEATTCSRATIYRAIQAGRLEARKIGAKTVVSATSLRRMVGEAA